MTNNGDGWRMLDAEDASRGLRKILKSRRKIKELDSVAAAINRCETIIEYSKLKSDSNLNVSPVSSQSASESVSGNNEDSQSCSSRDVALLKLMRQEKVLDRYLKAAGENDPLHALAYAKGDVAYLERLRASDYLAFTSKSSLGKFFLPVFIVVLTALFANVVGIVLQRESLEHSRRFEVQLERLREGQRLAGNLYVTAADFKRRTERDELRGELSLKPIGPLNEFKRELSQIRNVVAGRSNDDINSAMLAANSSVNNTIECFGKDQSGGGGEKHCSDKFDLEAFARLQDGVSLALVTYLH